MLILIWSSRIWIPLVQSSPIVVLKKLLVTLRSLTVKFTTGVRKGFFKKVKQSATFANPSLRNKCITETSSSESNDIRFICTWWLHPTLISPLVLAKRLKNKVNKFMPSKSTFTTSINTSTHGKSRGNFADRPAAGSLISRLFTKHCSDTGNCLF